MIKLDLRQAKPEDINDIVIINSIGFADYMNSKMGKIYIKAFYNWFINPEKNLNGISFVVCSKMRIAGFVVGAKIGYQSSLNKYLLLPAACGFLLRPDLLLQKRIIRASILKLKSIFYSRTSSTQQKQLKGKGISLVGISVHPDFRGQHAGTILMHAFEKKAKESGYDYMRLTVLEKNQNAVYMYSKSGWKLLENNKGVCSYFKYL